MTLAERDPNASLQPDIAPPGLDVGGKTSAPSNDDQDENRQPGQASNGGKKRKSTDDAPPIDPDDINVEGMFMDASCDSIRKKIRRLLDSGEMKVGEFANAIDVSQNSLRTFLGQSGNMKGSGSATYGGAWEFFKKRELAGVKVPAKKQKKTSNVKTTSDGNATPAKSGKIIDISGITLDGEDHDAVPVYDTCDEVRKKISAHLTKTGVTQAQFCRDLSAQRHCESDNIQSRQLTAFRSKNGPSIGNTHPVFYAAYVYFEKIRLAGKKPKSKHRQEMEGAHSRGFDVTNEDRGRYFCSADERSYTDKLGRLHMQKKNGSSYMVPQS